MIFFNQAMLLLGSNHFLILPILTGTSKWSLSSQKPEGLEGKLQSRIFQTLLNIYIYIYIYLSKNWQGASLNNNEKIPMLTPRKSDGSRKNPASNHFSTENASQWASLEWNFSVFHFINKFFDQSANSFTSKMSTLLVVEKGVEKNALITCTR